MQSDPTRQPKPLAGSKNKTEDSSAQSGSNVTTAARRTVLASGPRADRAPNPALILPAIGLASFAAGAINIAAGATVGRASAESLAFFVAVAAIQLRDRFLSLAAHELRSPLTAVKATVQVAQRRAGRAAEVARGRGLDNAQDLEGLAALMARVDEAVSRQPTWSLEDA